MSKSAFLCLISFVIAAATLTPGVSAVAQTSVPPTASPNKIAFLSFDDQSKITLIDVDSRLSSPLEDIPHVANFAFSPDGASIAFSVATVLGNGVQGTQLYRMESSGADLHLMTEVEGYGGGEPPVWSPDGRQIALNEQRDGLSDVYLLDPGTQTIRQLTTLGNVSEVFWTADGQHIQALSAAGDLYQMDVDGSHLQKLSLDDGDFYKRVWSADSQHIFSIRTSDLGADIYMAGLSGGDERLVTQKPVPGVVFPPVWSPDGQHMAFTNFFTNEHDIHLMDKDGSNLRLLVDGHNPIFGLIAWSPDGTQIAYAADLTGRGGYSIVIANVDGSGEQILTPGLIDSRSPAWMPG